MAENRLTGRQPYSYGGPGFRLVGYEPTIQLSGVTESEPDTAPTSLITQNVSVATGSLVLTGQLEYNYGGPGLRLIGFEPSAAVEEVAAIEIEVPAGSLAITGEVPLTILPLFAAPDVGAVAITGAIPTLNQAANHIRAPPVAALGLTGNIPALDYSWTVFPDAGSLTLSGQTPGILDDKFAEPSTGSLSLSGLAPTLGHAIAAGVGSLPLAGIVPIVSEFDLNQTVEPGTRSLTLTGNLEYNYGGPGLRLIGYEPAISLGGELAQPSTGALSLTGAVPVASENKFLTAGAAGTLTLTGQTPDKAVTADKTVQSGLGSLGLAGLQPAIDAATAIVAPGTGSLALSGLTPTVESRNDLTVLPGKGTLSLTTYLEYNYGGPGLRLIGYEPTLVDTSATGQVTPDNGILSLESHRPSLEITLIPAVFDQLIITGQDPVSVTTANHFPKPGTGSLSLNGLTPSVPPQAPPIPIEIPVGDAALNLAGQQPLAGYSWIVYPDTGSVTLTTYGFTFGIINPVDVGSLSLSGQVPRVDYAPEPTELTLTGYEPDLTILGLLPIGSTSALTLTGQVPTVINSGDLVEPEQPSGGYPDIWEDFERELARRKREKEKRRKAKEEAKRIKDKLDRELALEQRKLEEEAARKAELARINQLVENNRTAIEAMGSERLEFVMKEALERQTFSTMERLERELNKAHEEEVFLIMAAQILVNQ